MTTIEQVMFELERLLIEIEDHNVRMQVRQLIHKLSCADMEMSDLYAEVNDLRRQYGDILPGLSDDFDDTDDDSEDDNT